MSFNEKLISCVYEHVALWDPKHKEHKNKVIINKLWREVGKILETDVDTVKQKWKGLRDYYRAELRKMEKPHSGDASDIFKPSIWPYFKLMAFLQDTMKSRPRATNLKKIVTKDDSINKSTDQVAYQINPDSQQSQSEYTNEYENDSNFDSQSQEPLQQNTDIVVNEAAENEQNLTVSNTEAMEIPPVASAKTMVKATERKKKMTVDTYREKLLDMECKKIKLLEKEDEEDEDLLFFKSLLPDFKQLPRTSRMSLKIKFQQLLYDATVSRPSTSASNQSLLLVSPPAASPAILLPEEYNNSQWNTSNNSHQEQPLFVISPIQ